MKREFETIHNFLIGFFDQKLFFNDKSLLNINKLTILRYAKEEGLNIPSTFLTTKKEELNAFQKKGNFNKLLIKPISNNIGLQYNDENCITPNFLLETKEKAYMPDSFFISQFQNYIGKQIEIRAFYLDENIYAMAIFSQQDEKTKIDFRNYNLENPNRTAAFKLPKELTRKLTSLMKKINANAGSIDLILSPDNKYYFLEINPFGIFSMIEDVCNYGLYELVADSLINHSDHVKKNNK